MSAIETRNIKFLNKVIDGEVHKIATGGIGHIQSITDITVLNEFINKVTSAINGNFNSIVDPDVSSEFEVAYLTPTGVEIWDEDVVNVVYLLPLQDFKEILIAWRDFLLAAPVNGSRV